MIAPLILGAGALGLFMLASMQKKSATDGGDKTIHDELPKPADDKPKPKPSPTPAPKPKPKPAPTPAPKPVVEPPKPVNQPTETTGPVRDAADKMISEIKGYILSHGKPPEEKMAKTLGFQAVVQVLGEDGGLAPLPLTGLYGPVEQAVGAKALGISVESMPPYAAKFASTTKPKPTPAPTPKPAPKPVVQPPKPVVPAPKPTPAPAPKPAPKPVVQPPKPTAATRTPQQAALDLYKYVTSTNTNHKTWGDASGGNAFIAAAEKDMGMSNTKGVYGPADRTRGKELTGKTFPAR